ncbi:hypothetical protein FGRMN_8547 [Fusarium graminum]|nr:hypothetical protein FGRMN_8547 [Fusarium graminum]
MSQLRPDPSEIDPFDEHARREFVKAYCDLQSHEDEDVELWYCMARESIAKKIHGQGDIEVGHLFFEYMVDYDIWVDTLYDSDEICTPPAWPWEQKPLPSDMSQGPSNIYRQWRIDNGHPARPQQTPATAPVQEIASDDKADTAAPASVHEKDTEEALEPNKVSELEGQNQRLKQQLKQSNDLVQLLQKHNAELVQRILELNQ